MFDKKVISFLFGVTIFLSACGIARSSSMPEEAMILLSPTTEYIFSGEEELKLAYQQRLSFNDQILSTGGGRMTDLPSYYVACAYLKNPMSDLLNKETNCIFNKKSGQLSCDTKGRELRVMTATDSALFGSRDALQQTVIEKKNYEFEVLASRTIPNDRSHLTLIIDYFTDKEHIYALVGTENLETRASKEEVWQLNPETLETEQTYLVMEGTDMDAHYHSLVKVDDNFYLANSVTGKRADYQLGPGNHLLRYNLLTGEKEQIPVATPYPTDLSVNDEKNELIVHHQDTYVKGYVHTIVNLDTQEQTILSFEERAAEEASPTVIIHHGDYYFLFPKMLYRYNSTTKKRTETDLTSFGIENANNLMFYTKE